MLDWFLTPLLPWAAQPWLQMSPLEIVATVFGLWSVIAYVRESVWAWPAGLLNVLLYIVLFWNIKLHADTGLQVSTSACSSTAGGSGCTAEPGGASCASAARRRACG